MDSRARAQQPGAVPGAGAYPTRIPSPSPKPHLLPVPLPAVPRFHPSTSIPRSRFRLRQEGGTGASEHLEEPRPFEPAGLPQRQQVLGDEAAQEEHQRAIGRRQPGLEVAVVAEVVIDRVDLMLENPTGPR